MRRKESNQTKPEDMQFALDTVKSYCVTGIFKVNIYYIGNFLKRKTY